MLEAHPSSQELTLTEKAFLAVEEFYYLTDHPDSLRACVAAIEHYQLLRSQQASLDERIRNEVPKPEELIKDYDPEQYWAASKLRNFLGNLQNRIISYSASRNGGSRSMPLGMFGAINIPQQRGADYKRVFYALQPVVKTSPIVLEENLLSPGAPINHWIVGLEAIEYPPSTERLNRETRSFIPLKDAQGIYVFN